MKHLHPLHYFLLIVVVVLVFMACAYAFAEEPHHVGLPRPPTGTWGVHVCDNEYILWVLTEDSHMTFYDKKHWPKESADVEKLMLWIAMGPTDIVEVPCETVF